MEHFGNEPCKEFGRLEVGKSQVKHLRDPLLIPSIYPIHENKEEQSVIIQLAGGFNDYSLFLYIY